MAVFLKSFTLFTTHNNHIYIDMFTFVKQTLISICRTFYITHTIWISENITVK